MAITSKQRSQLRGLAAGEDTIIQVGKGGINDNLIASVKAALAARELINSAPWLSGRCPEPEYRILSSGGMAEAILRTRCRPSGRSIRRMSFCSSWARTCS